MFYELQDNEGNQPAQLPTVAEANAAPDKQVYQCKNCMTVYDEIYGDDINNIAPGTKFETIEQYQCPTCDSPKQDFVLLDSLSLAHQWNS
nr:rubredoxin [Mucilaginibacter rivuli]